MSSPNQLEIISRGSFEMLDVEPTLPASAKLSSQMSMEPLPPEKPRYLGLPSTGGEQSSDEECATDESSAIESSQLQTEHLLQQIEELSGRIRNRLGTVERPKGSMSVPQDGELSVSPEEGNNTQNSLIALAPAINSSDQNIVGESVAGEVCSSSAVEQKEEEEEEEEVCGEGVGAKEGGAQTEVDPKLLKALEKMKRLDKKLAEAVKKEKEVKRQRRLLEQQMTGESETQPATDAVDGYVPVVSPVFPTQVEEETGPKSAGCSDSTGPVPSSGGSTSPTTAEGDTQHSERLSHKGSSVPTKHGAKIDFVKRNIELATEAGALVAMTELEKQRLEELLTEDHDSTWTDDPGSTAIALPTTDGGSGFSYSTEDQSALSNIDSRLQAFMPPAVWESTCSSRNSTPALSHETQSTPFQQAESGRASGIQHTGPGQEVLMEFRMSREESEKLKDIEERLHMLQSDSDLSSEPVLASELQDLLEECRKEQKLVQHSCPHTDHEESGSGNV